MLDKSNANLPPRAILTIFNITKGGKLVYALISLYMFFVSITLPIIHYYKSKSLKNKYFQNPICSIHYFYKVLNTPSLLNELREIAIKEFSVENVLFWENYEILRNMSMEYLLEYRSFSQQETSQTLRSFDFEAIYKQQRMNYYPISPTDDITNSEYSSSLPIPQEIISYYTSFYHMFIDFNGPAVVGLQEKTIKNIINEFCTYPTIGVYDQAAHEVVEMMYHSLYPILLRQNQKHIMNTVK
ncbi:hypothetical protein BCR36DRAFT_400284 [Piromyces finnis]|uniref:RGS domain-containing protein n=1 Tax=Piromyces finnis TaxID=1754191 RepID=A0A1Y1UWV5_9FUNG|nr:hypothetical protein BCR36DRAFT_400284 [Piromyces finnis]|eukprot:ORX42570.1 hypothetical protein BCR36DRAFT_400284 [Piromyces finnis]